MDERQTLDNIKRTLTPDEAKLIILIREVKWGKAIAYIEAGKIVRKEKTETYK